MGKKDQELREHHEFTIRQNILEHCANLLDDENIIYHQRNLGISDPIDREESELHIRMADAAYREYEKTMYPDAVPDREDEVREALEEARTVIARMKRSILVHPDHEEGSEFDDLTTSAQEMENKISEYLTN